MNIGIDLRPLLAPEQTGVGTYTKELLTALFSIDARNNYFLFYNYPAPLDPPFLGPNVHITRTAWPKKVFTAAEIILHQPKLDTLVTKTLQATSYKLSPHLDYFFSPNLSFANLSKKTKHILTIHDLSFEFFPENYTLKQRLWHKAVRPREQCRRAHHIIAPSENTKQDITRHYGISPEKISIIYPGLTPPLQPTSYNLQAKYSLPENFILFLGTVEPRKNIPALIDAFEKSYSLLPNPYHLVIAGARGWKNEHIFKLLAASPLRDKIHYFGFVPAEEKEALLKSARLFVYPSFYEGFGFPVLEAMTAGTPVITSNRSSLTEVTGNSAYLINPNKPNELALGIRALLTNEPLRQSYIQKGLLRAQKFSWQKAAEQLLSLLK